MMSNSIALGFRPSRTAWLTDFRRIKRVNLVGPHRSRTETIARVAIALHAATNAHLTWHERRDPGTMAIYLPPLAEEAVRS